MNVSIPVHVLTLGSLKYQRIYGQCLERHEYDYEQTTKIPLRSASLMNCGAQDQIGLGVPTKPAREILQMH